MRLGFSTLSRHDSHGQLEPTRESAKRTPSEAEIHSKPWHTVIATIFRQTGTFQQQGTSNGTQLTRIYSKQSSNASPDRMFVLTSMVPIADLPTCPVFAKQHHRTTSPGKDQIFSVSVLLLPRKSIGTLKQVNIFRLPLASGTTKFKCSIAFLVLKSFFAKIRVQPPRHGVDNTLNVAEIDVVLREKVKSGESPSRLPCATLMRMASPALVSLLAI